MDKITYPTKNLLEDFLKNVYNNKSLSIRTNKLGTSTDNYDSKQPGMFETLTAKVTPITGIDVPILVKNDDKNKPVVAIIAQDPLRNANDKMLKDLPFSNPIVGTPFAIHYKQDVYSQTKVYRLIINEILNKGFDVYITDAHKIYPSKNIPKQCKKSERDLLIEELKVIKPDYIISFGSDAKDYIHDYITNTYQEKALELLHPSQTNWDHWKQWIFEQAFSGGKTYNVDWTKYASQIGCRSDMFQNKNVDMPKIISNIVIEMFNSL
jgi:hypothetical protein